MALPVFGQVEAQVRQVEASLPCCGAAARPRVPSSLRSGVVPRGSKYPIFQDSSPKYHYGHGFWDQRPYILGTWTLWGLICSEFESLL